MGFKGKLRFEYKPWQSKSKRTDLVKRNGDQLSCGVLEGSKKESRDVHIRNLNYVNVH